MPSVKAYIGVSGWNYPHWKVRFYPRGLKQSEWLGYFSRQFETVEVNFSFYRIPDADTVQRWQQTTPARFRFAVKMWRGITHYKKLVGCKDSLAGYFRVVDQFRTRQRGPLLVQLPPNQGKDLGKLDRFLDQVRRQSSHRWRVAVEFRNASWLSDDVYRVLNRQRAAICLHDLAGHGAVDEPNDANFVYIRRHGPGDSRYAGSYSAKQLEQDARRVQQWLRQGTSAFVYFNNDIGGCAVADAQQLRAMLASDSRV